MRSIPLLLLLLGTPVLAQDPANEPAPAPAPGLARAPAAVPPPAAEPPATPPATAAAEPTPSTAPPPAAIDPLAPPPPSAETPMPRFGLRLGLGVPDGATADLVFRPLPYLRLLAGPAWNYLAFGVQAGIAVTPIRWAVSPVLEVRYGHFFSSDLNRVVKSLPTEMQSLSRAVGYDYFNGQLALEFGSPRGFTFSLGVGLSYFWTTVHGSGTVVRNPGTPDQATVTIFDPSLRAVIPSLRLGWLYYF